jgi:hypothetical protein
VIPVSYALIRAIHEERIRAAQIRRPEWMYEVARPARPRASRQLRISIAEALRRIAASVEPSGTPFVASSSRNGTH